MIILEIGQSCGFNVLVGKMQSEMKGHDFLSVVPAPNQAGLVLLNGADPVYPAPVDGLVAYVRTVHPKNILLKFEAHNIPKRVGLLLQAVRDTFIGVGFDELVVTAGEYSLTISMRQYSLN